jgi:FixJ family two-component response regulator
VLDLRLPGLGGFGLQGKLARSRHHLPVTLIAGRRDIPVGVQAMKDAAIEFLTESLRDQERLDAINLWLERDRACRRDIRTMPINGPSVC